MNKGKDWTAENIAEVFENHAALPRLAGAVLFAFRRVVLMVRGGRRQDEPLYIYSATALRQFAVFYRKINASRGDGVSECLFSFPLRRCCFSPKSDFLSR